MATNPFDPMGASPERHPSSSTQAASSGVKIQDTADSYPDIDLIDHIEWRWSSLGPGWTMKVYPTSWLRLNGDYTTGELAWDELYAKYPSALTRNLNGMRDQFICHVELGAMKDTYNIDEWLPAVGYDATVAADCQPGKDS
jgi:hypothetical protein